MSKMAGKKKSCFQITSVTQAQVGASCVPDDTESLDDPDESRTEDVSSETFDVCRVDQGVCDRSSPEEALNNGGEYQEGQLPYTGPVNGTLCYKSAPTGYVTPHNVGGSVPVPSSNTVPAASVAPTAPSNSCSSRFRVIKLDHGTGEPFRRGRWTCTEFYEKDSDLSVNRTVDSIKPTVTLDQSIDRDSGLGATITSVVNNSAFSAQAFEISTDSGYSVSVGHPTHSHTSDPSQQGYIFSPQIGSGASAFQPIGFTAAASQQTKQAQVNMQPVTPQNFFSSSLNGVHQGAIITPASQSQQFAYSNHPTGFSGHPDYYQQHFGLNITSSSVGSSASQVSSPPFTPDPGIQGLVGQAGPAQGLLKQQTGMAPVGILSPALPGHTQQQSVNQTQPSGGLGIAAAPSATTTSSYSGGQNVPAAVPSTTNITLGVSSQVPSTGHIQLQGAHGGITTSLGPDFSNQAEDCRQNSDVLPHHSASAVTGSDGVKSPVSDGFNLPTPTVTSLFNIQIPLDEDEDRNPSTAFYQAFRPSKLRVSKPTNDSASGASVVAIDNKIEQAMDLVKSHLMYAVREEVEVLKEQIKELYERNSALERENAVLKSLANTEQLSQLSSQLSSLSAPLQLHQYSLVKSTAPSLVHHDGSQSVPYQPNITSA